MDIIGGKYRVNYISYASSRTKMAKRTLLMFHGLGGDGNTMVPIQNYCADRLDDTTFLPIEGPINFGSSSSPCLGWFEPPNDDNRFLDGPDPPKLTGLRRSIELVHQTIDELLRQRVDPMTIHLLGHSQGGAIAITSALTYPKKLGGVCTIAGYLALTNDIHLPNSRTKYVLHHSRHDDNVGFRWADYAKQFLEQNGCSCVVEPWEIKQNPHSIHTQQLDAICSQLTDA